MGSKFSQRHYMAIANLFQEIKGYDIDCEYCGKSQRKILDKIIFEFELIFKTDNSNFNAERFKRAIYE